MFPERFNNKINGVTRGAGCGSAIPCWRARSRERSATAGYEATLEHGGTTYYFIDERTKADFARKQGLALS